MYTPYIDSLAKSGVLLDNYYTQPVCSPSRTAFMQGRFPFRQGMRLQNYCTLSPAATGIFFFFFSFFRFKFFLKKNLKY